MSGAPGFHGRATADLAIGSVRGVRYWDAGTSGGLTGSWGWTWADGENAAECAQGFPHAAPERRCDCGFYGYWTEAAAPIFRPDRPVVGVIEGYGRTLIGDLGFRCAKAKIVALALAFQVTADDPDWIPPVRHEPPDALFWRGETGMATWRAVTGARRGKPPQVITPDCTALMAGYEAAIGQRYPSARVYTSPEIMLKLWPPTTEYIPAPEPEPDRCLRCGSGSRAGVAYGCPACAYLTSGQAPPPQPVMQPPAGCPCPLCTAAAARRAGFCSPDEVRQILGLDPGPGFAAGGIIPPGI